MPPVMEASRWSKRQVFSAALTAIRSPSIATALQGADSTLSADQATELATQMVTGTAGSQGRTWAAGTGQASTSTYNVTA